MKITTKTTKEQLKNFLGANAKAVKEANTELYDQIVYADKMAKKDDSKVQRSDLVTLAKEVIKLLGDKVTEPATTEAKTDAEPKAENSVKKLTKGSKKKAEEPKAEAEPTAEAEEPKAEKKKVTKKAKATEKKEKEGVKVLNNNKNEKTVQLAEAFPQTLEVEDIKYELASDIKTMEDLYKAYSNGEEIVLAYYWTKRHLRQFEYFGRLLGQPKSFDNDLDLCALVYVSDEMKVGYGISRYTEAFYTLVPSDLAEEDGFRVASGVEYQIYRAVK